jgi:hypothetical protein
MAFEPLLGGLTWIFVVIIPLALLIVLFDSNADPAPLYVNTRAAHLRGDADSRSASDSQLPSPSPERCRPRHRPPVPLAPIPPLQSTGPGGPPTASSRRIHAMNTHIDQLMARRHVQTVFDDNSDFDFHPGDEEEYWIDEEEELSFSSSSQYNRYDRDRYHDSQDRAAPSPNKDFSGNFMAAGEKPSAAAPHDHNYDHDHQPRKTSISHNTASKPTPNRPSSCIPDRSPQDGKSNFSQTGRQASINTHVDALMRQQGIQHTNWAHVDMPFERSAGEHQFQDVESHIRAEGEDPSDVYPSEGSAVEAGKPYSDQRASENRTLGSKGRASSSTDPEMAESMYELVRERQEQAQQQQEPTAETSHPESNRDAARTTTMMLPYSHRYDAERDLLTSSVPSASARCRTESQPQPRKQVHFSRPTPSTSAPQLLYAEDPVFGTGAIDTISPSVARQVEMRAEGVLHLQDEDEFNCEQDWSNDEYRYGDIAGTDYDDDWTEMPSDR